MSYVRTVAHQVGTFALLCMTALGAGCADSPTSIPDAAPLRATTLDPALALSGGNLIGQRVSTDRYVQVFSLPSRQSAQLGQQRNGIRGTIVNGPSPLTSTNPYPLYQVNFDSGPDGWVLGVYLSLLAPLPPTPPPTAVSVASSTAGSLPIARTRDRTTSSISPAGAREPGHAAAPCFVAVWQT